MGKVGDGILDLEFDMPVVDMVLDLEVVSFEHLDSCSAFVEEVNSPIVELSLVPHCLLELSLTFHSSTQSTVVHSHVLELFQ